MYVKNRTHAKYVVELYLHACHDLSLNGETNIWGRDRDWEILKHFKIDESETETFGFSKLERDRDETESLLH